MKKSRTAEELKAIRPRRGRVSASKLLGFVSPLNLFPLFNFVYFYMSLICSELSVRSTSEF